MLLSGLVVVLARPGVAAAEDGVLLVYLPGAPIESGTKLAEAVTELGRHVESRMPDISLEVRAFRRWEDAVSFLGESGSDVALLVCDPAFLLDLPDDFGVVPVYRFLRSGSAVHRKLVVVRSDRNEITSLAHLRDHSISVAIGASEGSSLFLERVVFGGEIAPDEWFSEIRRETDDFSATVNVLFERTDASLVSEDNPLVIRHLGKELREVYASAPVSRSVLAVRAAAFREAQRDTLDTVLAELGTSEEGRKVLAGLRIDGLRPIEDGSGPLDRMGLLTLPSVSEKPLEIATRPGGDFGLSLGRRPSPEEIPYTLGIELFELPLSFEIADRKTDNVDSARP